MVVETIEKENLSIRAAMQEFGINDHKIIERWERIYWEEGPLHPSGALRRCPEPQLLCGRGLHRGRYARQVRGRHPADQRAQGGTQGAA